MPGTAPTLTAAAALPAASSAAEVPPMHLTGWRLAVAGFALALCNFTVVLDITIANVSVPHIAGGLAISPSQGTWAITSYAVAEAITVPLSGWLASRFGTVRWLVLSLIGFGIFSFLCGTARSIELLILFRILQGLSGGPLMPLTQTLLQRVFPPEKVPMALGLWAMTTIAAPIVGPILGGTISDNWSWPWIFFINLPVVAGCAFVVSRLLPPFETVRRKVRIDTIGLVLLIIWIGAFQIMLDTGREYDWFESQFILALAIIATIGFIIFVIWEWYEPEPIVNIRLLKDRTLAAATAAVSVGYGAFFGTVVLVPLWLQQVVGYTATEAGYVTSYQGMLAVMMAPVAALLLNKIDPRITVSVAILWMAGTTMMRMGWNIGSDHSALILPQILQGIGMPFFFVGLTSIAMSRMRPENIASAAGLMTFARTMCGAVATATASTLWISNGRTQGAGMVASLNDPAAAVASMERSGMSHMQALATLEHMVDAQAMTGSALYVFSISAMLFVFAASLVWLVPRPTGPITGNAGAH